jgi:hypothetical protein
MSKQQSSWYPMFCSRTAVYRFCFILGVCFLIYLFIYEIDIKATVSLAHSMLPSLTFIDRSNSTAVGKANLDIKQTTTTTTQKTKIIDQVTTMSLELTSELTTVGNSNISQPKEAFVTFSNNNPTYLSLLYVLLDSVHAFSTRPIIAYGIDVDLNIDLNKYPRVIKRSIKQSDCGPVR